MTVLQIVLTILFATTLIIVLLNIVVPKKSVKSILKKITIITLAALIINILYRILIALGIV